MKIKKETVVVNGKERITWDGQRNLCSALKEKFGTQGNLYLGVFGVSLKDAEIAGWNPDGSAFTMVCNGWTKFLKDKGNIARTSTVELVDVIEAIFPEREGK